MTIADDEHKPTLLEEGSPCLQGECVAFTGTLASMPHRMAHELVGQHGGTAQGHISKNVTMLVVGEEGWPLEEDGRTSVKLEQVAELQRQSLPIRILNESEWLHLLGLEDRRCEVHRLYTPAMLARLLDVSANLIRSWERAGLIRPVRKIYRLPYFDFQEVTGARRLFALLEAGVPRSEIEASLHSLQAMFQGVDRPLAQLEILARDAHILLRDDKGLLDARNGQRFFDFEPEAANVEVTDDAGSGEADVTTVAFPEEPPAQQTHTDWTGDDWFEQGVRLLEHGESVSAVEAFRLSLMQNPSEPEVHFQLADALYRIGNLPGALERYHVAVELDHNYIEAWTQLGCLHEESGQLEHSAEAFQIALAAHPEYADAHYHLAEVLHGLQRTAEALPHWEQYLHYDSRGPWAERTRQRIAEATSEQA